MTRPSILTLTQPSVSTLPQLNQLIKYRWVIVHAAHGLVGTTISVPDLQSCALQSVLLLGSQNL